MNKISNRLTAILFCLAISVGVFFACRKTDGRDPDKNTSTALVKFFGLKPGTDTTVAAIADAVRRQNEKRHFVDKLINKAGVPVWDKAVISEKEGEGKQIFIPFVLEKTKQTRALLIAMIKDRDTAYRLVYNSRARHFGFDTKKNGEWNAKDVFHAFVLFDNKLFDHTKFTLTNGKYLDDTTSGTKEFKIQFGDKSDQNVYRGQGLYPVTTWVTFITCGLCGFKEPTGTNALDRCCNATYNIVPVIYWFNDETDETSYELPVGVSEDGGGMLCPGCSWDDTNPCDIEPPYTQVCDGEWTPTLHIPAYTPFQYDDTIRISNGLETVFPCIADFIRDSLANPNLLAQIAGADVFHDSAEYKLSFDTSTVDINENSANSATTSYSGSNPVFVKPDGTTVFSATIKINPWYLRHGTREWNIANILHEIMHAAFTLRWGQYLSWVNLHDTPYDSNFIKTKFPIYWYQIQNQAVDLTALQEHEIMATDYVEQFSNIMRQFYNPNASTAIRDTVIKAIAYNGLLQTTIWKDLPRIGIDTCKYKNIMVSAAKSGINLAGTGCGGSSVYRYAQDLKLRPHCQ